jgi:hypothetical protein
MIRAHPKLAGAGPKHGVADDERRVARQPWRDLISPLDVEHEDSVEELVAICDCHVECLGGATS